MAALQKNNLGVAPTGAGGDSYRDASSKANDNVDVLNSQATLGSAPMITAAQALTAGDHLGKRVSISLAAPGTIQMPAANTCVADGVIHLRNLGATLITLAVSPNSGDTVSLSGLGPGESATMDTDGVHAWAVLMRGRTSSDNEIVNGNLAVGGTISSLKGALFGSAGQVSISQAGAYSGPGAAYVGDVTVGGALGVTGSATFKARPTINGNPLWDSGNLPAPMTRAPQSFSGNQGTLNLGAPATNSYTPYTFTAPAAGAAQAGLFTACTTIGPTAIPTAASTWFIQLQLINASGAVVASSGNSAAGTLLTSGFPLFLSTSLAFSGLIPGATYRVVVNIVSTSNPGVSTVGSNNSCQGIVF